MKLVKVVPLFKWYDLWVGFFWDAEALRLYVLPVPCLGFVLHFSRPEELHCPHCKYEHSDYGEWWERPHHTHLCFVCGKTWTMKRYAFGLGPYRRLV